MCKYCDLSEATGENLPLEVKTDGTKQHYEAFILDDVEYEQFSLNICGTFSDLRIKVHYCPMCGKKL
ncbi:hypothetical protein PP175_25905 (plasmid) [Aneurinibacillus sp. Ricciae_BoGa-3]|uniref:hypothetical protein n=1 Tax=Aneurinibacillus sp. Ricciae_BoGa-3 TaxID=3022697 RepID=UPI0023414260|nr:hypothetical protein [Aneurinibacillus sp. Ricciae_BoGa-3]WCK57504.1 hypothetical protein PP175_25905 [Aneurinibacillus sp. Ricciae_BoGa-3]